MAPSTGTVAQTDTPRHGHETGFRLFDLPLELRMLIYELLGSNAGLFPSGPEPIHSSHQLRILRQVNRQTRQETDYLDNHGHLRALSRVGWIENKEYRCQLQTLGSIDKLTVGLGPNRDVSCYEVLNFFLHLQQKGLNRLRVLEIDLLEEFMKKPEDQYKEPVSRDKRIKEGFVLVMGPYSPLMSLIETFRGLEKLEIAGISEDDDLWNLAYPIAPRPAEGSYLFQAHVPELNGVRPITARAAWQQTRELVRTPVKFSKRWENILRSEHKQGRRLRVLVPKETEEPACCSEGKRERGKDDPLFGDDLLSLTEMDLTVV